MYAEKKREQNKTKPKKKIGVGEGKQSIAQANLRRIFRFRTEISGLIMLRVRSSHQAILEMFTFRVVHIMPA